ncbi:MAG: hypothetical protein JZD41_02135 [Thermoproteus sp.]|nr:hypothetical protein [Thermoproteus sp.]
MARLRPIDVVKSDHALQKRPRVAFYMAERIMKEYGLYPSLVDLHNGKTKVQWVFPISVLKQVYEKMKEEESQQITKAKY